MARTSLLPSIAVMGSLAASMALIGCDDVGRRTAHAETSVAKAEVSTELPPDQVSDEFLQATATVAAEAASVPHPVAAAVVAPVEPPHAVAPPPALPQDNATANRMPSAADAEPDPAGNRQ